MIISKIALYMTGKETGQWTVDTHTYTHTLHLHICNLEYTPTYCEHPQALRCTSHPYGRIHTLKQTCCHNRSPTTHTNTQ